MCGRFVLKTPVEELARLFGFPERPNLPARYNVAPTTDCAVVRPGPSLALLRWGLMPYWAKDLREGVKHINARAETIATNRIVAEAFARRRCLVPADGFYEWTGEAKAKQPWFIAAADGKPLAFAGVWERWRPRDGGAAVESFAILTTAANTTIGRLHDRMPAVLPREAWGAWLDGSTPKEALLALLQPAPDPVLVAHKVDRRVGNVREDDPQLILALA